MKAKNREEDAVDERAQRAVEGQPDFDERTSERPGIQVPRAIHVHHVVA
jgi:hypothetical protein